MTTGTTRDPISQSASANPPLLAGGGGAARRRVLYIVPEWYLWEKARSSDYTVNYGIEEGLMGNGAEVTLVPAFNGAESFNRLSWLSKIRQICEGKTFDQVWMTLVHVNYGDDFLEWISTVAPVRVGLALESLNYTMAEYLEGPSMGVRRQTVLGQAAYLTHVLCTDEADAEEINRRSACRASWWPNMVPRRCVFSEYVAPSREQAAFIGAIYGERKRWLETPGIQEVFVGTQDAVMSTDLPARFEALNSQILGALQANPDGVPVAIMEQHVKLLRMLRREAFGTWAGGVKQWVAMVNLPTFVKNYTTRVPGTMAAGVPMISWDVPDRPRNRALFEPGGEILLFRRDDPEQFVEHVRHLRRDGDFARELVFAARERILRYHTAEYRVGQTFEWIEKGTEMDFGEGDKAARVEEAELAAA